MSPRTSWWPKSASTCRASKPRPICCPGPACARATTKAPASAAAPACAAAASGSRPRWCRPLGPPSRSRAATCRPSSIACAPAVAPKKPSSPLPPRCSPPSGTCCATALEWHDLGAAHFDRADAKKTANRLIRRLQQMGYAVQTHTHHSSVERRFISVGKGRPDRLTSPRGAASGASVGGCFILRGAAVQAGFFAACSRRMSCCTASVCISFSSRCSCASRASTSLWLNV